MIKKISHIGIAVKNLYSAKEMYKKLFQTEPSEDEIVSEQKVKSVLPEFLTRKGKRRIIRTSSDSKDFSSPAILKCQSQFKTKKMKVMSKEITTPENMFRNKMDLKLPGETQPVFKSVLETTSFTNPIR